jgi:hypothetical protein
MCLADESFPRGSLPWILCRELGIFGCIEEGWADVEESSNDDAVERELEHWAKEGDYGPILRLLIVEGIDMAVEKGVVEEDWPIEITQFIGGRETSDEDFLKDVRMFTRGDHGLAVACRFAADRCFGLKATDIPALLDVLPEEFHEPVTKLINRRGTRPDEPPADALEAVMLDCWHSIWKDQVEVKLRAFDERVAKRSEAETATK